jgi:hypothetical protein
LRQQGYAADIALDGEEALQGHLDQLVEEGVITQQRPTSTCSGGCPGRTSLSDSVRKPASRNVYRLGVCAGLALNKH